MRSLDDVKSYYESKLREFGATAKGVDWNGEASQRTRFDQLSKVLDRMGPDERFSILDVGCGYGALAAYLRERFGNFDFVGYDISPEMTRRAAELHRGEFTSDINRVPACDYAVASGVFNVKLEADETEWLEYVMEMLAFIDRHARRGWSANFLTRYSDADKMRDRLYYADPLYLFDYVVKRFSRWAAVLHDYGLYEFTLIVRKD